MPYITVEGNALEPSQKRALIEQLTATASAIMHVPPEFFLVTINELPDENIGIGGDTQAEIDNVIVRGGNPEIGYYLYE